MVYMLRSELKERGLLWNQPAFLESIGVNVEGSPRPVMGHAQQEADEEMTQVLTGLSGTGVKDGVGQRPEWRAANNNLRFLGHKEGVCNLQEENVTPHARKAQVRGPSQNTHKQPQRSQLQRCARTRHPEVSVGQSQSNKNFSVSLSFLSFPRRVRNNNYE